MKACISHLGIQDGLEISVTTDLPARTGLGSSSSFTVGLLNGILVGISAAIGMYIYARMQGNPSALTLACVVWFSMVLSCITSGLCGAMIPLILRKFGADPATASSIVLTTATDVVSMGVFLGLATIFVR